jgi:predicted metal-dependent hydrolase
LKTLTYTYLLHSYHVHIRLKKQRKLYFRYIQESIHISAPLRTSTSFILLQLDRVIEKLLKTPSFAKPIDAFGMYLFGSYLKKEEFLAKGLPTDFLEYTHIEQQQILKKQLYPYVLNAFEHYRHKMHIDTPYKISIRTMKTRYGSHARRTKKLTFATHLVHYHPQYIDAVMVHELAHHFHFDHSENFYQCLLHYFPRYKEVHAKLKAHQFYE